MKQHLRNKWGFLLFTVLLAAGLSACTNKEETVQNPAPHKQDEVQIQVFLAASLRSVMEDLADRFKDKHPDIELSLHADSSGTLLAQIKEGYTCDIFFSAAQKQMDQLEEEGLLIEGTRKNVVGNQVVVLTYPESGTKVTGLSNLTDAKSIALAGGSVPAGCYTREALIKLGLLEPVDDAAAITTREISAALGGIEISEQDNVSKELAAVVQGACEVGTAYYSDTYGWDDEIEILEKVSYDLTGPVSYPICLVQNKEADNMQTKAAQEFYHYILSDEAQEVFRSYYFDTEIR